MKRREFLTVVGAAIVSPRRASAQTSSARRPRVGAMLAVSENDTEGQSRFGALRRGLEDLGFSDGREIILDARWYEGNFERAKIDAAGLINAGADVLVVNGSPGMDALREIGAKLPIVFAVVSNPVGAGYVSNLARPGGNITGFSTFEPEITGKWLQHLLQIAPNTKNVHILLDPKFLAFYSLWEGVASIAPKHAIVPHRAEASTLAEIERALNDIADRQEASALIVGPSPINTVNRKRLISLANERRIPAIYPFRFYVQDGALIAYGFNAADQFRRAASYVVRILKGEKPGDLPVQAPNLFELGLNLKTAKMMGISLPQSLIVAADEIVE